MGVTWEGGEIEDPQYIPKIERFQVASRLLEKTPNRPENVKLTFQKGIPVALNGKWMKLSAIIMALNAIAGRHGVGVVHHLEDRLIGLQNRRVYEAARRAYDHRSAPNLEKYVRTRLEMNSRKRSISNGVIYVTARPVARSRDGRYHRV